MKQFDTINFHEILNEGVIFWNNWRKENPTAIPDLSNLQLINMDLSGYDFFKANFRNSCLFGSDLSNCNFKKSSFVNSDLTSCLLNGSKFIESIILGCNFLYTTLKETVFLDSLIKDVKNIDKCIHKGRSYIDGKSFKLSRNLPESFLIGCGLADWEYEVYKIYDPEITLSESQKTNNSIYDLKKLQSEKFYSCFISYSSNDEEFASKVYTDISRKGAKCWFAPKNMVFGSDIYDSVDLAIESYEKIILILSTSSSQSVWVEDEVKKGFAKEKTINKKIIIPILLTPKSDLVMNPWVKKIIDNRHFIDFKNWHDDNTYLQCLETLIERSIKK